MAGEFQKDVKFNEIEVGDMILVELFGETGEYFGDRRGTAKERIGDIWYFDDMYPVYKDVAGYRMFKVTEIVAETTVPVAELERLRGIEERAKALYAVKDQEAKAASARMEEAMSSDDIGSVSAFSHARTAARWYGQRKELEDILDL
jgi:hypothetical protein